MLLKHIFFTLFFVLFFLPGHAQAESKNRIESMNLAGLEKLMKGENGPCLIAVMAAWCSPCIKELPALIRLYDKYKKQGLKLFGISVDFNGPSAMQPIVDKLNVNFPVYWVGEEAIYKYEISAIPLIFFIQDGRNIERVAGKRTQEFLDKRIKTFLK